MGQILDVVPNHMGVGAATTPGGRTCSRTGRVALRRLLRHRLARLAAPADARPVLLPVLGDQYGARARNGANCGSRSRAALLRLRYYDSALPVEPRTYDRSSPRLADGGRRAARRRAPTACRAAEHPDRGHATCRRDARPTRTRSPSAGARSRSIKRRLARAAASASPRPRPRIDAPSRRSTASPASRDSFDRLDDLLSRRRTGCASGGCRRTRSTTAGSSTSTTWRPGIERPGGLRGRPHELIRAGSPTGKVDGLRIDHPDGLFDPSSTLDRLQAGPVDRSSRGRGSARRTSSRARAAAGPGRCTSSSRRSSATASRCRRTGRSTARPATSSSTRSTACSSTRRARRPFDRVLPATSPALDDRSPSSCTRRSG